MRFDPVGAEACRPSFLTLALLAVAGLIATQIALPRISARRLADALRRSGDIDEVRVRAVPALKLLFNRADVVEIWTIEARTGPGRLGDVLEEARRAGRLDAHAAPARVGPLVMRNVRLSSAAAGRRRRSPSTSQRCAASLTRSALTRRCGRSARRGSRAASRARRRDPRARRARRYPHHHHLHRRQRRAPRGRDAGRRRDRRRLQQLDGD